MSHLPVVDDCRSAADVRARAKRVDALRKASRRPPSPPPPPPPEAIEAFQSLAVELAANLADGDTPTPKAIGALEVLADGVVASFAHATVEAARGGVPPTRIAIISVKTIVAVTAAHFGMTLRDFTGRRRDVRTARARQVAMYLSYRLTGRSLPQIGLHLGGRDHSTVLHGVQTVQKLIDSSDEKLIADIADIKQKIVSV